MSAPTNTEALSEKKAQAALAQKQYRVAQKATAIGFGVFALLLFLLWKNPVSLWISLGIAAFGLAQIGFLQMLISLEKVNEG